MRTKKHVTQSMQVQVQMGILDEWVFDILYTQWHVKSNYKGLETNTRKPELNDDRHQATLSSYLCTPGAVSKRNQEV
jgi:hypothetical protein